MTNLGPSIDLIVVGCSAGGIDALCTILPALSSDAKLAIAVVLHLPQRRVTSVAEIFKDRCTVPVCEADDKQVIQPATIYFAPSNYHLLVEPDLSFALSVEEQVNYSRPAIDLLFESAAFSLKERVAGVLLTGANHDGAKGLQTIATMGGMTVVQNPNEAVEAVMPRSALSLMQPSYIMRLGEIAGWIRSIDRHKEMA